MVQINDIKCVKNGKCIVKAIIDEQEIIVESFLDVLYKYSLKANTLVKRQSFNQFVKESKETLLYNSALKFIAYQSRSVQDVKKRLLRDTQNKTLINNIIDKLTSQKYLGDKKYAEEFVFQNKDQLTSKKWIENKLKQKGISDEIISAVLTIYDESKDKNKVFKLLKKEGKVPIKKPYYRFKDAFYRKCINKGFGYNVIDEVFMGNEEMIKMFVDENASLKREKIPNINSLNYNEKQKLINKLRRKGYSSYAISKYLNEGE